MLVLAVMTPTLVGLAASPYVNEPAILAVYFPAIMLAAVLLGWRLGLIATALSILAHPTFVQRRRRPLRDLRRRRANRLTE